MSYLISFGSVDHQLWSVLWDAVCSGRSRFVVWLVCIFIRMCGALVMLWTGLYSINECPVRFRLVDIHIEHPSPSSYAYIPYLSHMHAIGASEGGIGYEIERVNSEDHEGNQESEVQPTWPKELEEEVECRSHEPRKVRESQGVGGPTYFTKFE
jgi:hypothetical protein